MGKGRHVVIHDVIHDDNEMGNRPLSYQDVALHEYCNFHAQFRQLANRKSEHDGVPTAIPSRTFDHLPFVVEN